MGAGVAAGGGAGAGCVAGAGDPATLGVEHAKRRKAAATREAGAKRLTGTDSFISSIPRFDFRCVRQLNIVERNTKLDARTDTIARTARIVENSGVIQASTALSFAATATAMVITPGAGFVLFSSTLLTRGRRAALVLWAGIAMGTIVFAASVVVVYPLIVGGIGGFRRVLQIAGGLFLVYLGVRGVYRARRHRAIDVRNVSSAVGGTTTTNKLAIEGLTSALTNPGLFVVYVLLLPTFVPPAAAWTPTAATLAAEHIGIMNVWYSVLFVAIGRARGYFTNDARQAAVAIVSSLVLVGLGVRTLHSGVLETARGCATSRPLLRLRRGLRRSKRGSADHSFTTP